MEIASFCFLGLILLKKKNFPHQIRFYASIFLSRIAKNKENKEKIEFLRIFF